MTSTDHQAQDPPSFMRYGELLAGFHGLALLRGRDAPQRHRIVDSLRELLASLSESRFSSPIAGAAVELRTGYDQWSATYDEGNSFIRSLDDELVRPLLTSSDQGSLALDMASGTGRYAQMLAAGGCEVIACDLSAGMLRSSPVQMLDRQAQASMEALPFADASFGVVACGLAMTHIPNLSPVFDEAARILIPGGCLVVSDAHFAALEILRWASTFLSNGAPRTLEDCPHRPSDYFRAASAAGFGMTEFCETEISRESALQLVPPAFADLGAAFTGLPCLNTMVFTKQAQA